MTELKKTHQWQRARARFLAANPLCSRCSKAGLIEPAVVVDHVTPHRGDYELFWDVSNWQPLCQRCHNSDKQSIEKGGSGKPIIGIDGWPL